jgi:DNA-binding transcriptional LysR family regulator
MLSLRQIEVFRAVMRAQTVVGAASQLHVAQPTVTKTIRRIEDVLKTPLFDRSSGRLTPTPEARRMLEEVDRVFIDLEGAIQRVTNIASSREGLFRFGASPSLGRVLIPRVVAALLTECPDVLIHFDVLSVSQILDYLTEGPGEGAVTMFPVVQGGVHSTMVGTGKLVALIPKTLPQARAACLAPQDLSDATLITFEPRSVHGQLMSRFLGAGSVTPRRTHLVRFAETAVGFAEAGVGVALVDEFSALSADKDRVAIVPTSFDSFFQVHLNRHVASAQSQLMRLLEDGLRRALAR